MKKKKKKEVRCDVSRNSQICLTKFDSFYTDNFKSLKLHYIYIKNTPFFQYVISFNKNKKKKKLQIIVGIENVLVIVICPLCSFRTKNISNKTPFSKQLI